MSDKETPDLLPELMRKRALREPAIANAVIKLAAELANPDTEPGRKYRGYLKKNVFTNGATPRTPGRSKKSRALEVQLAAERKAFTTVHGMTKTKSDELLGELNDLSPSRVRALAARGRKRRGR